MVGILPIGCILSMLLFGIGTVGYGTMLTAILLWVPLLNPVIFLSGSSKVSPTLVHMPSIAHNADVSGTVPTCSTIPVSNPQKKRRRTGVFCWFFENVKYREMLARR